MIFQKRRDESCNISIKKKEKKKGKNFISSLIEQCSSLNRRERLRLIGPYIHRFFGSRREKPFPISRGRWRRKKGKERKKVKKERRGKKFFSSTRFGISDRCLCCIARVNLLIGWLSRQGYGTLYNGKSSKIMLLMAESCKTKLHRGTTVFNIV